MDFNIEVFPKGSKDRPFPPYVIITINGLLNGAKLMSETDIETHVNSRVLSKEITRNQAEDIISQAKTKLKEAMLNLS